MSEKVIQIKDGITCDLHYTGETKVYTHDGGCTGLLLYTSTVFLSATYIPIRMQTAPTTK